MLFHLTWLPYVTEKGFSRLDICFRDNLGKRRKLHGFVFVEFFL